MADRFEHELTLERETALNEADPLRPARIHALNQGYPYNFACAYAAGAAAALAGHIPGMGADA